MGNPIFQQIFGNVPTNPMLQQFLNFKKNFNGNPQQIVQNMLNSGKITQDQYNQILNMAKMIRGFIH